MKTMFAAVSPITMVLVFAKTAVQADIHRGAVFAFGGGDPHVTTWGKDRFEFQQEGDLVLVQNAGFSNGLGLDIHIRTTAGNIEAAVLRIGEETVQVQGGLDHGRYWINGEEGFAALEPRDVFAALEPREEMQVWLEQGYEVTIRQVNPKQFQVRVDLGNDEGAVFGTSQHYLRVDVQANDNKDTFTNSVGLLGSFPEGVKLGRDKTNIIENADDFAMEWQTQGEESATALFRS